MTVLLIMTFLNFNYFVSEVRTRGMYYEDLKSKDNIYKKIKNVAFMFKTFDYTIIHLKMVNIKLNL